MERIPVLALLLVLLAGCATAPDPIAQDPVFDPAYPALSSEVVFESGGSRQPAFAAQHRIDPLRLAIVGHSMGGFAALVSAAELPAVDCAASLAGANLGLWAETVRTPGGEAGMARALDSWSGPIRGTSGAALVSEIRSNEARFELRRHAPQLAAKPLLLVAGNRDDVTPSALHHEPLAAAIAAQRDAKLQTALLDADHAFADRRVELTRRVLDWLRTDCALAGVK